MNKTAMPPDTATGTLVLYVPPGADREKLLSIVRLGVTFKQQQRGKRPSFLHNYLVGVVARMQNPTFEDLLDELSLAAERRDYGSNDPIERVSRSAEILTYHDPLAGRVQISFGTLRNKFTAAKNK